VADLRILLFTGNGGAGRTTIATGTALRLAERGTKTLLLSMDGVPAIGDVLACEIGDEPTPVASSLWAAHIDTQHRLELGWRDAERNVTELFAGSGVEQISPEELTVLPGVEDVLAVAALREFAVSGGWDVLVVDCPPAPQTVRRLAVPETLAWYARRALPVHRAVGRSTRPLASLLHLGDPDPGPTDALFAALVRLDAQLTSLRALLADPAVTTVRLVVTPDKGASADARHTLTALALYGYAVDLVIANRMFPKGRDAFRQGWVAAQQRALAALRESLPGVPVREIPYLPQEPIGVEALGNIADALYGTPPGDDPTGFDASADLMTVAGSADGYVLRIRLPLTHPRSVAASRAGDDLILTVAGHRRIVALPSVLRRCEVVSGEVVDGEVHVHFRRDAALWPVRST
jgi:arsenite/tail-anchored protein-transporting ATPase